MSRDRVSLAELLPSRPKCLCLAPRPRRGHLAKLSDAGLLALEKQSRRRYFRLASPLVARMLEGLMVVAQEGPARQRKAIVKFHNTTPVHLWIIAILRRVSAL